MDEGMDKGMDGDMDGWTDGWIDGGMKNGGMNDKRIDVCLLEGYREMNYCAHSFNFYVQRAAEKFVNQKQIFSTWPGRGPATK